MFTKNIGTIDRAIRIILGALLMIGAMRTGQLWMWIGIIPLLTGLISSCPLYTVFGIKTCKTE
ncbi:YgaP family membrane protein [Cognatishimia activa]|uniref:Inner membrane protein YgaP-like transmembrane domain-containing protein n=1 Tax=Cognatishimia activa TaxID=1715691 RepID=A0A0P1ITU5_9RHOB|nr:DUF2892 domain-containing protein [Cognatishimia activa]CUJ36425.1 hypothetical protein TA5113_03182 [Cognatishimia activa]CUK27001.1 hypothetical protein TA5114_02820 [Cognatishimia activa]